MYKKVLSRLLYPTERKSSQKTHSFTQPMSLAPVICFINWIELILLKINTKLGEFAHRIIYMMRMMMVMLMNCNFFGLFPAVKTWGEEEIDGEVRPGQMCGFTPDRALDAGGVVQWECARVESWESTTYQNFWGNISGGIYQNVSNSFWNGNSARNYLRLQKEVEKVVRFRCDCFAGLWPSSSNS